MHEMLRYDLFIGGRFMPAASGKRFAVHHPGDGHLVAEAAEGDKADIEAAAGAAKEAFPAWSRMSPTDRARILNCTADILDERMEDLIRLEVLSIGRPVREMSAQLPRVSDWLRYFASLIRVAEGRVIPISGPYVNYTQRVPLGVVGLVTPWNHPLLILIKKVAPAIATGNTIVVKPSELGPLTALELARAFHDAGLPRGVFNVVPGYGPTAGMALCSHPAVRKIDLTGGTETGKTVASLAGQNLARVTCELGGKAPVIIFDDSPLEQAVNGAAFAAFIAAGQVCVQGARLIVHQSIHDRFVEALVEKVANIRVGDPRDPDTQMGPVVSAKQLERVEKYVAIGREEGARVAYGGERIITPPLDKGFFIQPTIFVDVKPTMTVAQEEIFGPVTTVIPFATEDEAVSIANSVKYGLGASVWTRDVKRAHRVADRLEAGVIWINDHHRIDPASPWGGFKQSGMGRENGWDAYFEYTEPKSVIVNVSEQTFDWFGQRENRLN